MRPGRSTAHARPPTARLRLLAKPESCGLEVRNESPQLIVPVSIGESSDVPEANRVARMTTGGRTGPWPAAHLALRAAVGAAVLTFVVSRAHLTELRLPGSVGILRGGGAAVLLLGAALVMSAVRWWLILGAGSAPLRRLVSLYFVSQFFSLFLPTSVGGDAVRILALSQGDRSTGAALSSVVIDRMLGLGALVMYGVLGSLLTPSLLLLPLGRLSWRLGWHQALLLVVVAGVACALVLVLGKRWVTLRRMLHDARGVWARLRASSLPLIGAALASLLVQATYISVWYALAAALDLHVAVRAFLVFVPFVSLAAMLPVTISGLGVREGVWTLLLQPLGISSANAIAFGLLYYVANLLVGVIGGGIYVLQGIGVGRGAAPRAAHDGVLA